MREELAQTPHPAARGSLTMILKVLLLWCVTGLSSGVLPVSEEQVTSRLYGSVILPCKFSFVEALAGFSMIWDKKKNQRRLILYKILNGKEKPEEQDPQYRGRVELSAEFSHGNLHLILRNVTYEDEGTYYCRAANTKGHGDRKVTLFINTLDADEPTVTLVTIGEKRRMKCRGSGVYHLPEVQWITARGEDLSSYGRHNISEQSNGWRLVESVLDYHVGRNVQVLCHIKEGRLRRSTRAVISDGTHPVSVDKL